MLGLSSSVFVNSPLVIEKQRSGVFAVTVALRVGCAISPISPTKSPPLFVSIILAVPRHLGGTVDQDEELAREPALMAERAGLEVEILAPARDRGQLLLGQPLEERHALSASTFASR